MLLAIDLQVGSVILKAIIVPSFQELGMLSAIVGIKIVLGWTLSKEVNRHRDVAGSWDEGKKEHIRSTEEITAAMRVAEL